MSIHVPHKLIQFNYNISPFIGPFPIQWPLRLGPEIRLKPWMAKPQMRVAQSDLALYLY